MIGIDRKIDLLDRPIVLLTGASGFIGRNIAPILEKTCTLLTPTRRELNVLDGNALSSYIEKHGVQVLIHSANPNPVKNPKDDGNIDMFATSLKSYMNIFRLRESCPRILYFGSGAEYDKRYDIACVAEDDLKSSNPVDAYGEAKYIMNSLTKTSDNITNLRVFGCYGPHDHDSKFITHCIRSVILGRDITIRQDCKFDYLHVYDLAKIVDYFVHNQPQYRDYNVASGDPVYLSEIARMVLDIMESNLGIRIACPGLNHEYTASVARLEKETGLTTKFISLREGIQLQIQFEKKSMNNWIQRYL